MSRAGSVTIALTLLTATPAAAQIQVDIAGYGGLYVPTSQVAEVTATVPGAGTAMLAVEQKAGLLAGARLDVWLGNAIGVEGNFAYAFSDVRTDVTGVPGTTDICEDPTENCNANVWYASGKLLYRVFPTPTSPYSLHVGGGVALINRGGDFWDDPDVEGTMDVGGVLGAGFAFDVSPSVAISLDVEDYIYSAKITAVDSDLGPLESDSKVQNDFAFTAGVVVKLVR